MKLFLLPALLLLFLSYVSPVQAEHHEDEPLAMKMTDRLKTGYFDIGILLQSRGVFSFEDDLFLGGRKFDLGATRLDIRGNLDEGFMYRLQLDLRNSPSVIDAQVGYRFSDEFRLVAGAFKPFTSLDLDPGPGNTDFINRARHVGAMMSSREIGITAMGNFESGFNYRAGIYNGTGLSRINDNAFMYSLRLAYETEIENGRFHIGTNTFYVSQNEPRSVGNSGLSSVDGRLLYGAFLEYDQGPFFSSIEFLQTRFDARELAGEEELLSGFYITAGLQASQHHQLVVRWDYLGYDQLGTQSDRFILGWNYQATSLVSFSVNAVSEFNDDGSNNSDSFGLLGQMQFQF